MSQMHFSALPASPDAISPDGSAEFRRLLTSPGGDLTHAVCLAGNTSGVHHLPELDVGYFVLAGAGEIWRASDDREVVTALRPGRWVAMPKGMRFQYRADQGGPVLFLMVVLPSWREALFHVVEGGPWGPGIHDPEPPTHETGRDETWLARDLPFAPDDLAPDGSEIRLLGSFDRGGLAHCTLHPGLTSLPVRHRTVHEIWFVLSGYGELWRAAPEGEVVVPLWPAVAVEIAQGTSFQFRTTGAEPLRIVILTMPKWPGPSEAEPALKDLWKVAAQR